MLITVRFEVPPGVLPPAGACATVGLQDVGRADAAATTVAERTILLVPDDDADPGDRRTVEVELTVPRPDPRSSCSVRVHVDVTGSGEVSAGDLVSTTHVGVTAADEDQVVEVPLQLLE